MNKINKCKLGLWDDSVPALKLDDSGVSNFAKMQLSLMKQYPRGEQGKKDWDIAVSKMKKAGKNKKYDCVLGVSGGTDSSYLLHVAKKEGLRVLAVNLDNGWSSDIAVKNIKLVTSKLNYDLETYVIDYNEVIAVLKAYIKAGLPWIDSPTDIAIKSTLYKIANREGIKYILNGSDFRSEGKQPLTWTYSDTKQLKYIVKNFSDIKKLKSFPLQPLSSFVYFGVIRGIKVFRPLYFLPYEKKSAKILLAKDYGWVDYGGHHHENIFTKFAISYWLPVKFNIDKRIITCSAQIISKEINREEGLSILSEKPYSDECINAELTYVLKKLKLSREEFDIIFKSENKYFYDYPSYYQFFKKYAKPGKWFAQKIFGFKPGIFEAIDQNI